MINEDNTLGGEKRIFLINESSAHYFRGEGREKKVSLEKVYGWGKRKERRKNLRLVT